MIYESRVKYLKIDEVSGREKQMTETYVIPTAETFSDAEKQTYDQMAKITLATVIPAIKISDVDEILLGDGDWFYKAKIAMISVDEVSGKETETKRVLLIQAHSFDAAYQTAKQWNSESIWDMEILEVKKSGITDVFEELG